jgi:V8-like Glu-specific endopeptidase
MRTQEIGGYYIPTQGQDLDYVLNNYYGPVEPIGEGAALPYEPMSDDYYTIQNSFTPHSIIESPRYAPLYRVGPDVGDGTADEFPNPDIYPFSTVCRIVFYTNSGAWVGSGMVIGPRTILTAAHVISGPKNAVIYHVYADFKVRNNQVPSGHRHEIVNIKRTSNLPQWPNTDLALLYTADTVNLESLYGVMGVRQYDLKDLAGMKVQMAGYPGGGHYIRDTGVLTDDSNGTTIENYGNMFYSGVTKEGHYNQPLLRVSMEDSMINVNHNMTSVGGMSGSGIWVNDPDDPEKRYVVGVHAWGWNYAGVNGGKYINKHAFDFIAHNIK